MYFVVGFFGKLIVLIYNPVTKSWYTSERFNEKFIYFHGLHTVYISLNIQTSIIFVSAEIWSIIFMFENNFKEEIKSY